MSRKHNHFEVNAVAYRIGLSKFNSPVVCFGGLFQGISVGIQLSAYSARIVTVRCLLAVCKSQKGVGSHQLPVPFHPAVVFLVDPRPVSLLHGD